MKWQQITLLSLLLLVAVVSTSCAATQPSDAMTGGFIIDLGTEPDPPVAGQVVLTITLRDANQQAVDGAKVNLLVSHSSMATMLLQNEAVSAGNGKYSAPFDFSQDSQGEWRVTVEVRNVQSEVIRKNFTITIP